MRMGVVADDITGANDIGIMFAKGGCETHVYLMDDDKQLSLKPPFPEICIVDTNSRLDPPQTAYDKVFAATRALAQAGCPQFHNKTCSVFRGNIGIEFDAMLDALNEDFAGVVLGYPKNGRLTIDGKHFVHGRPLAESEFSNDPVHPARESDLLEILRAQTRRKTELIDHRLVSKGAAALREAIERRRAHCTYLLFDVPSQEALLQIAYAASGLRVLCGSSAIAEELPRVWGLERKAGFPPVPFPLRGGVLCIAGSLMPQTQAQLDHLQRLGVPLLEFPTALLFDALGRQSALEQIVREAAHHLAHGIDVAVHASRSPDDVIAARQQGALRGFGPIAVARLVSETLAEAAAAVLQRSTSNRLVAAGGETSAAVVRRLNISGVKIWREIETGLPSCLTLDSLALALVLKSGSFGQADFLEKAVSHLKEESWSEDRCGAIEP